MIHSKTLLHTPARRLRLHEHSLEAHRRRASGEYPRGYIEQLARTFSGATIGSPVASRRPRPPRTGAATGIG